MNVFKIHQFATQCYKKFRRAYKIKKRSKSPWKEYGLTELLYRLKEETRELELAILQGKSLKEIQDECYDVTNFAWFIYERTFILKEKDIWKEATK